MSRPKTVSPSHQPSREIAALQRAAWRLAKTIRSKLPVKDGPWPGRQAFVLDPATVVGEVALAFKAASKPIDHLEDWIGQDPGLDRGVKDILAPAINDVHMTFGFLLQHYGWCEAARCVQWFPCGEPTEIPSSKLSVFLYAAKELARVYGRCSDDNPHLSAAISAMTMPQKQNHRATIVHVSDNCYAIGNSKPVRVTPSENAVLMAFLANPQMNKPDLQDATDNDNASKVLRNLKNKYDGVFASAITCPGAKSKGGYHVRIKEK